MKPESEVVYETWSNMLSQLEKVLDALDKVHLDNQHHGIVVPAECWRNLARTRLQLLRDLPAVILPALAQLEPTPELQKFLDDQWGHFSRYSRECIEHCSRLANTAEACKSPAYLDSSPGASIRSSRPSQSAADTTKKEIDERRRAQEAETKAVHDEQMRLLKKQEESTERMHDQRMKTMDSIGKLQRRGL